jgi:type IV pilus assembly protein PilE
MPRQNEAGVTLIELMVVMAIVAILASVAVPSYRRYVLRTNRTDAVRGLTLDAQIMQRCYSQNFTFNLPACTGPLALASANGNYNLAFGNLANNTYTLTATPRGAQVQDTTCASFTLDQTGRQTALDTGNNDQSLVCWGAN